GCDPHARHPITGGRPQRNCSQHDPAPPGGGLQFSVLPGPPAAARCQSAPVATGITLARRYDRLRPPQLSPDRRRTDRPGREVSEHPRCPRRWPVLPDPVAAPAISLATRAEFRGVYSPGRPGRAPGAGPGTGTDARPAGAVAAPGGPEPDQGGSPPAIC